MNSERFFDWVKSLRSLRRRWLGLIAGSLLWLLFMVFGFWATILLFVLAAVGFIVGRVLEEHQSWKDIISKLIAERYGD